ncbi:MAG: nitrogenase [Timaviella obliquedivisa GSE-PSE-MK23-08B]|jgi:tellurite resistance protein|nr:nitrogenase [Timaviella obliquedivisa GSE-PSE-MK23-08B]
MVSRIQYSYTDEQITAWLRGLLSIAWADGHFSSEEQALITTLMEQDLSHTIDLESAITISPAELAEVLGQDAQMAENFLRTAVMVAIADGTYSPPEDELLHQFCTALKQQSDVLAPLRLTLSDRINSASALSPRVLNPLQEWLDRLEVQDPRLARFLCRMIPSQCPFERDITLFGRKLVHIPPMCKINPLYEQLVGLRFRALSYLADDCQEDVAKYC